jgi:hypothetical protein
MSVSVVPMCMANPSPVALRWRLGTSTPIVNMFNDQFCEFMATIRENPEQSYLRPPGPPKLSGGER